MCQKLMGPCPMQLVVVMAVRKAVRAATITFTAISRILFDFISDLINEWNERNERNERNMLVFFFF